MFEKTLILAFAPVLGAILGSFSTMLIYRLHHDKPGVLLGRSECPNCKKTLDWFSLIPIFSWCFQRGKCHNCGQEIPAMYPLIEIVFAVLFFVFVQNFYSIDLWWILPMVFLFLVLFFYDLWFMEVDDRIVVPAIVLALIASFFREMDPQFYIIGGLIGLGFYGIQYLISRGRWVGAGDLRFGLLLGLVFGWQQILLVLFGAYILGTIIAVGLMCTGKYGPKSQLPMGAFLMPVALFFLYTGDLVYNWYVLNFLNF